MKSGCQQGPFCFCFATSCEKLSSLAHFRQHYHCCDKLQTRRLLSWRQAFFNSFGAEHYYLLILDAAVIAMARGVGRINLWFLLFHNFWPNFSVTGRKPLPRRPPRARPQLHGSFHQVSWKDVSVAPARRTVAGWRVRRQHRIERPSFGRPFWRRRTLWWTDNGRRDASGWGGQFEKKSRYWQDLKGHWAALVIWRIELSISRPIGVKFDLCDL